MENISRDTPLTWREDFGTVRGMSKLTFEFDNPQAAQHFIDWLWGVGEQSYWLWMEYREQEEDGDITGRDFDIGETLKNGDIIRRVPCGRMDERS